MAKKCQTSKSFPTLPLITRNYPGISHSWSLQHQSLYVQESLSHQRMYISHQSKTIQLLTQRKEARRSIQSIFQKTLNYLMILLKNLITMTVKKVWVYHKMFNLLCWSRLSSVERIVARKSQSKKILIHSSIYSS